MANMGQFPNSRQHSGHATGQKDRGGGGKKEDLVLGGGRPIEMGEDRWRKIIFERS
jgi:hypothetical protein